MCSSGVRSGALYAGSAGGSTGGVAARRGRRYHRLINLGVQVPFTVAIDGPAAAGKGTIARALAAEFGFAHLDTGLLYRAVGRRALDGTPAEQAAATLRHRDIARDDLRTQEVAEAASQVAAMPKVREALVAFQRTFARQDGGAILDGRDIGTVICPDADIKLYVTADIPTRASRRWKELTDKGSDVTYETVLAEVEARDARDASRSDAPMRPAADAAHLDTTTMDIATAIETAAALVRSARS